eukprot:comp17138_c0_seq1/m.15933 comp17138_c0_seq1/g.15933  ORF comp17138_c0_seq1/g.15933 comp17138_c0_seq1/m.15933 type:complete len:348 (-) comp17138_c0_seq1:274-1317(-)
MASFTSLLREAPPVIELKVTEEKIPPKDPKTRPESPLRKMVIAGGISFMFELCCGHALQFMKIQRQTTGKPYRTLFKEITRYKGYVGLLDGFLPWGAIIAVGKGAVFGWGHAASKQLLVGHIPEQVAEVVAGGMGGLVQGIVANPILLLNTRVMTNPEFRRSSGFMESARASTHVFQDVVRREGPLALMKGAHIVAGKRVLDWSSRFFFVAVAEYGMSAGHTRELSFKERGVASLTGGMLSCFFTLPLDVMVATVQQNAKAKQKVPFLRTVLTVWQSGGFRGALEFSTRGMVARAAHVALATFLMKTVTSVIYQKTKSDTLTAPIPSSLPATVELSAHHTETAKGTQ